MSLRIFPLLMKLWGLGPHFPIPVEVVPFCHEHTARRHSSGFLFHHWKIFATWHNMAWHRNIFCIMVFDLWKLFGNGQFQGPIRLSPCRNHQLRRPTRLQGHQGIAHARGLRTSAAFGSARHVHEPESQTLDQGFKMKTWIMKDLCSCAFHCLDLRGNSEVVRRHDTRAIPDLFWANQFLQSAFSSFWFQTLDAV